MKVGRFFQKIIDVNLVGTFNVLKLTVTNMLENIPDDDEAYDELQKKSHYVCQNLSSSAIAPFGYVSGIVARLAH